MKPVMVRGMRERTTIAEGSADEVVSAAHTSAGVVERAPISSEAATARSSAADAISTERVTR